MLRKRSPIPEPSAHGDVNQKWKSPRPCGSYGSSTASSFFLHQTGKGPVRGSISFLLWSAGLIAACGGKVVVDDTGSGGSGGASTVDPGSTASTSSEGPNTTTTANATTAAEASSSASSSSGGSSCDNTGICVEWDGPSCMTCAILGPCFDLAAACVDSSECQACDKCLQFCKDDSCIQSCYSTHPFGAPLHYSMFTCIVCDVCHNDCKSVIGLPPICSM